MDVLLVSMAHGLAGCVFSLPLGSLCRLCVARSLLRSASLTRSLQNVVCHDARRSSHSACLGACDVCLHQVQAERHTQLRESEGQGAAATAGSCTSRAPDPSLRFFLHSSDPTCSSSLPLSFLPARALTFLLHSRRHLSLRPSESSPMLVDDGCMSKCCASSSMRRRSASLYTSDCCVEVGWLMAPEAAAVEGSEANRAIQVTREKSADPRCRPSCSLSRPTCIDPLDSLPPSFFSSLLAAALASACGLELVSIFDPSHVLLECSGRSGRKKRAAKQGKVRHDRWHTSRRWMTPATRVAPLDRAPHNGVTLAAAAAAEHHVRASAHKCVMCVG